MLPDAVGSPPQVRGKHYTNGVDVALAGITPAGAGKTRIEITNPEGAQDHPRRCGENHNRRCMLAEPMGSPPQVRGKLRQPCLIQCVGRITPAGAGKTYVNGGSAVLYGDHPRRCGENTTGTLSGCLS